MSRALSHLAVVGASVRAAAESVYLSGRTAQAADLFADADLRRLCAADQIDDYPEGIVDWLQSTECDAWLYTGALENHPELVDELARVRPLMGNSGAALRRVRDPLLLRELLTSHGLPFPETFAAIDCEPPASPWLAKSYQGSSGSGVGWSSDEPTGFYWQRYVDGLPATAIFAGETLLGVSRQLVGEPWTGAGEFQYCGSIAPWTLFPAAEEQLREVGCVLAEEFELQGLFGVDFVFDGEVAWPVEVNPRYTASVEMLEAVYPLQAIDWHLSACAASGLPALPPPTVPADPTCVGKAVWFADSELLVSERDSQWALSQRDLSDIPLPGTRIEPGDPVLTVRAETWTADETLATLKRRLKTVVRQFDQE